MVTKFYFSIGGYPGPWNSVKLKKKSLYFSHSYREEESNDYLIPIVNNEDWNTLIEFLSTRKWKGDYQNPGTLDGTSWSLKVKTDTFQIDCKGTNKFPVGFKKFLRLLNQVIEDGPPIY
jgi:hypothetical protein